jgi:predicted nuclease with TOPRIM domain
MAFTRALLQGMSLTEEQVNALIEEHTTVTNALKEQRDKYKEQADKLPKMQKEFDELKQSLENSGSDSDEWKQKYEEEHKKFEDYKTDVQTKEEQSKIKSAYKKLLVECGVGEKHIDSILRVTDFTSMKLDKEGALENVDSLKKGITEDYGGFISSTKTGGADVDNPPKNDGNPAESKGRAAELAAKYHDNLYGSIPKEG